MVAISAQERRRLGGEEVCLPPPAPRDAALSESSPSALEIPSEAPEEAAKAATSTQGCLVLSDMSFSAPPAAVGRTAKRLLPVLYDTRPLLPALLRRSASRSFQRRVENLQRRSVSRGLKWEAHLAVASRGKDPLETRGLFAKLLFRSDLLLRETAKALEAAAAMRFLSLRAGAALVLPVVEGLQAKGKAASRLPQFSESRRLLLSAFQWRQIRLDAFHLNAASTAVLSSLGFLHTSAAPLLLRSALLPREGRSLPAERRSPPESLQRLRVNVLRKLEAAYR